MTDAVTVNLRDFRPRDTDLGADARPAFGLGPPSFPSAGRQQQQQQQRRHHPRTGVHIDTASNTIPPSSTAVAIDDNDVVDDDDTVHRQHLDPHRQDRQDSDATTISDLMMNADVCDGDSDGMAKQDSMNTTNGGNLRGAVPSGACIRDEDAGVYPPYAVVWTTLPVISWLCPVIGHMGITDRRGITYDFSGSYSVTCNSLMCGPAKRVWHLDPTLMAMPNTTSNNNGSSNNTRNSHSSSSNNNISNNAFDINSNNSFMTALAQTNRAFEKKRHNLFLNNCHHHVATVLNRCGYAGRTNWTQVSVCWHVWRQGTWTDRTQFLSTFTPFIIITICVSAVLFIIVFHSF